MTRNSTATDPIERLRDLRAAAARILADPRLAPALLAHLDLRGDDHVAIGTLHPWVHALHVHADNAARSTPHPGEDARCLLDEPLSDAAEALYDLHDAALRAVLTHDLDPTPLPDPATLVDVVGLVEIADRLGVKEQTARNWRTRPAAGLPEPRWTVSGSPAWSWETDIYPWAVRTGRMPSAL